MTHEASVAYMKNLIKDRYCPGSFIERFACVAANPFRQKKIGDNPSWFALKREEQIKGKAVMQLVLHRVTAVASLSILTLLTGCSGGGGSSPPPPPPPQLPLTASPGSETKSVIEGDDTSLVATLTIDRQVVTDALYIRAIDSNHVVDSNFSLSATSNTTVVATFRTLTNLSIGTHAGRIDFFACRDSGCNNLYSQTPASLNYTVTVEPVTVTATITPLSIAATVEEGDGAQFTINARVVLGSGSVSLGIDDSKNIFKFPATSSYLGPNIDFDLRNNVPPGTYTGSVNIYVCKQSATACNADSDVFLSPLTVPYAITVTPIQLLPNVSTTTGLPEWSTHQGNAGHTGHVPVTLDPNRFAAYWSWSAPSSVTGNLTPATTGSGKVVLVNSGYFSQAYLYALNEADGSLAWQHDFGSIFAVNHPAVADGRVFVASSGHQDTFMWSFDINDGTVKYKTAFYSQWDHYLAPVVKDGYVFTDGGGYGGMYRFKERTGFLNWFGQLQQYDLWSPAVDDLYAYAYTGNQFIALDKFTGERVFAVDNNSFNGFWYALNIAPVVPGDGSVVVVDGVFDFVTAHQNQLIRYSIVGRNESWRVGGSFASNPVVSDNTLYVLNAATNALEARSLATGQLLWSWIPTPSVETVSVSNLVLADNMVFVRTSAKTHAISLTTHQSVWSIPAVGHLALSSNKVLYIVSDKRVDAINLN